MEGHLQTGRAIVCKAVKGGERPRRSSRLKEVWGTRVWLVLSDGIPIRRGRGGAGEPEGALQTPRCSSTVTSGTGGLIGAAPGSVLVWGT